MVLYMVITTIIFMITRININNYDQQRNAQVTTNCINKLTQTFEQSKFNGKYDDDDDDDDDDIGGDNNNNNVDGDDNDNNNDDDGCKEGSR